MIQRTVVLVFNQGNIIQEKGLYKGMIKTNQIKREIVRVKKHLFSVRDIDGRTRHAKFETCSLKEFI